MKTKEKQTTPYEETQYGFKYGPAEVIRLASDPARGVWLEVKGKRESAQVRVTKGGKIRVFNVVKALMERKVKNG